MKRTLTVAALALALAACNHDTPPAPKAAPPPPKSAFEVCLERLDRDYPAMTTSTKVIRCK